jgi:hypothetical protein
MIRHCWSLLTAELRALVGDLIIILAWVWYVLPGVAVLGMVLGVMWAMLKMGEGEP